MMNGEVGYDIVGDFVDRRSAIGEVLEIVRAMVDANDAVAVMVDHEYNAIAFRTPKPLAANFACTDYSVAKGEKLVAYRWDGEPILLDEKFYWVRD
jgi:hypothetical protein